MVRFSTPLAVLGGLAGAALVTYAVVATAKPKKGSWRFKLKTWLRVKWPLTHKYLTLFDDPIVGGDEAVIAWLRDIMDLSATQFTPKRKVVRFEDVPVTTRDGATINVRVHIPPAVHNKPLPVVYYIHGGAWFAGSLVSGHTLCQVVAHDGPFVVVAVDYRLAPEHKFPVPLNDSLDALAWTHANAHKYGGNGDKIALLGDSAGGNLVLAAALENADRDEDTRIPIQCQTAVYPVADCDFNNESYKLYGTGFSLPASMGDFMFKQYTDGSEAKYDDERVSVLRTKDVSKLPPTQMITAEWDILRDEGFAFVDKLREAKVDTEHVHYLRSTHGFFSYPTIGSGTDAKDEFVAFVRAEMAKCP